MHMSHRSVGGQSEKLCGAFAPVKADDPASAPENPGLSSLWASALQDGSFSDVTFRVGEKDFPVCRLPLAIASPVFAAMFFGDWAESPRADARVVLIEDLDASGFEQVLRYCYQVPLSLTLENVVHVWKAADKYQLPHLAASCRGASLGLVTRASN